MNRKILGIVLKSAKSFLKYTRNTISMESGIVEYCEIDFLKIK